MLARITVLVCALALAAGTSSGQPTTAAAPAPWRWWLFEPRRYYDPLVADPRAAQQQALPGVGRSVPFMVEPASRRRMWDIDVGAEMPLFGRERAGQVSGRMGPGGWGIGSWFVVDFHMLEDLQDPSAPILNNDYRFGLQIKAQRGLSDSVSWLAFKAHAGHESTHIGDEYALAARRLYAAFERINVSYEWLDLGVSYERMTAAAGLWTIRGGAITTLPFGDSYYAGDTLETAGRVVTESSNWIEPYAGAQYRHERLAWLGDWGMYASLDARLKSVYAYHKTDPDAGERMRPALNLLVGLVPKTGGRLGSLGTTSPYARAYYGVNPHGQFRNQSDFWLVGLGLRLDR